MSGRVSLTSLLVGGLLLAGPPLVWQTSLPDAQAGDLTATAPPVDDDATADAIPPREPVVEAHDEVSRPDPGIPLRLRAPAIDLDAPIDPVGLEPDGGMELPRDVDRVGWYEPGVRPGEAGSAVLAGHVDSRTQGEGALFELRRLEPDDQVVLTDDAGWTQTWQVTARTVHPRDELPVDELFRWDGPTQLTLITCGGDFDPSAGGYADNVVIHAVLIGDPTAPTGEATDATTPRR